MFLNLCKSTLPISPKFQALLSYRHSTQKFELRTHKRKLMSMPTLKINSQKCRPTLFSKNRYFMSNTNKLPQRSQYHPYYRLCRWHLPIGAMLLYWPTAWGVVLGAAGLPNPYFLLLFLAGSWTARSAGCIVNDYLDMEYDRKVERTKTRPLASGQVSVKQAAVLLFLNLSCGLFVLSHMQPSTIATTFGFVALGALYPLAKRYTNYPQFILGMGYNSGIIIGSLTMNPTQLLPIVLPLYLSGIAWTLIYDTVYAYQDIDDDIKIGVKSTAVTWKDKNPKQIMEKFAIFMMACHIFMPIFDADYIYSVPICVFADIMLIQEIRKLQLKDKIQCGKFFKNNNIYGAVIFLGLLMTAFVKSYRQYCDRNAAISSPP